jgi:hypothetical protein
MARAMANELFTYERVEAEQCIMGKFYDVPSPSAAEEWAVALRARIMTGVQERYDEEGVDPPALVRPLLSSPPSIGIRISYGQLVLDPAANEWYDANKENDADPNEWFKYTDDDPTKKIHYVRAPTKNGHVECYRLVASREWKFGFVAEYRYPDGVVLRLNCQKRGGAHCHYGDRPPAMQDRSYACSTAIGVALLQGGGCDPALPQAESRRRKTPSSNHWPS